MSGHFSFLDTCDADIDIFEVALCKDTNDADRRKTHERIFPAILDFLTHELPSPKSELSGKMHDLACARSHNTWRLTENPAKCKA